MLDSALIFAQTILWLLRRCGFLLQRKGQEFVDRVTSMFPNLPRPLLRGVPATSDDKLIGGNGIAQMYLNPPPQFVNYYVSNALFLSCHGKSVLLSFVFRWKSLCHVTTHVCKQTETMAFEWIFFVKFSEKRFYRQNTPFSRKMFVFFKVIFSYRVDWFIDCDDELTIEKVDFILHLGFESSVELSFPRGDEFVECSNRRWTWIWSSAYKTCCGKVRKSFLLNLKNA